MLESSQRVVEIGSISVDGRSEDLRPDQVEGVACQTDRKEEGKEEGK